MSCRKIYGPFFFLERTINDNIFLYMIQQWSMPQVQEDYGNEYILQLDGVPSHFTNVIHTFLNENLPNRRIEHSSVDDLHHHHWPSRSPDLTPLIFFLWDFIKDKVFVPPLPQNLRELRACSVCRVSWI